MTNRENSKYLIEKYVDSFEFDHLAKELLRECGAIEFTKVATVVEKETGTNLFEHINEHYTIIDDVVFSADKKELIKYAPEKDTVSYKIPEFVEIIAPNAFTGNEFLTEIIIGKLKYVNSNAFIACPKLKTVHTDNIDHIWKCGWSDINSSPFINGACLYINGMLCDTLTLPNRGGNIRAFQGCESIKHIKFNENNELLEGAVLAALAEKNNIKYF